MQPARAVRAEDERLLDVGRARRAGDEIEGSRHDAFAVTVAHLAPDALIIAENVARRDDDEMIVGQEVQGRRIVRA